MNNTIVVMPAYKAEKTVKDTCDQLPKIYDHIIICDDCSPDKTFEVSNTLNVKAIQHEKNKGYGGNQKTLYKEALKYNPKIIIMVHPDNQYNTECLPKMIELIEKNNIHLVLGTRMKTALQNKMPWWKYISNKFLTLLQNLTFKTSMSEFHSGLRVYDADLIRKMPYHTFSNDFVFDSEVIAWACANNYILGEYETECYYNETVSSINFKRSFTYGLNTLNVLFKYTLGQYTSSN